MFLRLNTENTAMAVSLALQTFPQDCGARLLEGLQLKLWESERATALQMQKG